jgi:hypothetical protein
VGKPLREALVEIGRSSRSWMIRRSYQQLLRVMQLLIKIGLKRLLSKMPMLIDINFTNFNN